MNRDPGQNWLLLRGLARESAHWSAFVAPLDATFSDATVTMLDLPGTGRFHKEVSPRTIKAITDAVRGHALDNGCIQTRNDSGDFAGSNGCLGVDV